MSFLRKRLTYFIALIISMILAFFILVDVLDSKADSSTCLNAYTNKEVSNSRKAALLYLADSSQVKFSHPTLLYHEDSLIYWAGTSFPVLQNKFLRKDSSFTLQVGQTLYRIHAETLKEDFRMITAITLVRNGAFLGNSILHPSCWSLKANDLPNFTNKEASDLMASIPHFWTWLYLCLAVLLASAFALSGKENFQRKNKFITFNSGIPFFLALFFMMIPTLFSSFFSSHWLTQSIDPAKKNGVNLLLLIMLFTAVIYFLGAQKNKIIPKLFSSSNRSVKISLAIGSYLFIALGAIGLIFLIRYIHAHSGVDFVLDQLNKISLQEISYLTLYLLIIASYFVLAQKLYRIISTLDPKLWIKLIGIISGLLLLILTFSLAPFRLDIMSIGLSFLILIVSLDLYQDKKSLNSTWTLTWMILMAAFLSLLVFQLDIQHDMAQRKLELSRMLKERDLVLEKSLQKGQAFKGNENYQTYPLYTKENWDSNWLASMIQLDKHLYFSPFTGDYYKSFDPDSSSLQSGEFYLSLSKLSENEIQWLLNERYALLSKDSTIYQHGLLSQPGPQAFTNKQNYKIYTEEGKSIIVYSPKDGQSLLHEKKYPALLRPISLFSLLFFMLSVMVFLISLFNSWIPILPDALEMKFFQKKSLRNRIQISIISLLIASFLVIGLISQHYLQSMAKESSIQTQMEHAEKVKHRLSLQLATANHQKLGEHLEMLSRKALDLGEDQIVFYGSDGVLNSSQTLSDGHSFIPNILPYPVYQLLNSDQSRTFFFEEKGSRKGVFFKLEHFEPAHFAFIPEQNTYYGSSRISDILATFLSIYTLLFILSGMIAIVLSNSITRPIELLGKKLRGLKLSKKNEPVQWKNQDEIGALIAIYNEMIQKLSDNAKVMAKVERDSAWKEMAKQVAHEIKNPLTPLKLNIQYLEAKIRMSPEDAPGLITQITPGLIEQIDNLSQIASEFSNFAQLPSARNEKIRLNEIVKTVHDFFRKREDLKFQLFVPINDILVFADRNHLVRILNNVVKNAIQAIPPEREGEITLRLYTRDNDAIVQVSDNGSGIPDEMQDKVFSPNFTTKSSGTGLGLAISLNMLESFNGRIYFETEENEGTDFFIEIPLMRLEDNYPESNKVVLDF